jgi:hypothetical protein
VDDVLAREVALESVHFHPIAVNERRAVLRPLGFNGRVRHPPEVDQLATLGASLVQVAIAVADQRQRDGCLDDSPGLESVGAIPEVTQRVTWNRHVIAVAVDPGHSHGRLVGTVGDPSQAQRHDAIRPQRARLGFVVETGTGEQEAHGCVATPAPAGP